MIKLLLLASTLFIIALLLYKQFKTFSQKKLMFRIDKKFEQSDVLALCDKTTLKALQSQTNTPFKGAGALVLTHESLSFFKAYSEDIYTIKVANITQVVQSKSFLSKRYLKTVLIIRFSEDEALNSVAFTLSNMSDWENSIKALMRKV